MYYCTSVEVEVLGTSTSTTTTTTTTRVSGTFFTDCELSFEILRDSVVLSN